MQQNELKIINYFSNNYFKIFNLLTLLFIVILSKIEIKLMISN